jgi:hypothetical protein
MKEELSKICECYRMPGEISKRSNSYFQQGHSSSGSPPKSLSISVNPSQAYYAFTRLNPVYNGTLRLDLLRKFCETSAEVAMTSPPNSQRQNEISF